MNSDTRDAIYEDNAQERRGAKPRTKMINVSLGFWLRADSITSVIARPPTLSEKARVEILYGDGRICNIAADSHSHAVAMADKIASLI